jgi:predicted permease
MMTNLLQDVRYALRQLRKSPGFTITAVLTLALGIGATTAMYSIVRSTLLAPLPYPHAEELVGVGFQFPGESASDPQTGETSDLVLANAKSFASIGIADGGTRGANFSDGSGAAGGAAQTIESIHVSEGYLRALGVRPLLGRVFTHEDDVAGAAPAVLVSESLWRHALNADPGIVGRVVHINSDPYTVIGVIPWAAMTVDSPDVWLPLQLSAKTEGYQGRNFEMVARLKPGVTMAQARGEMGGLTDAIYRQYPKYEHRGRPGRPHLQESVWPLRDVMVSDAKPSLVALSAAVFAVLLMGCLNLAGLIAARSSARKHEIALRTALGAGRIAVLRLLLVESVLLALCGSVIGLVLARLAVPVLLASSPLDLPQLRAAAIDLPVAAFAVAVGFATTLLFGLIPALGTLRQSAETQLGASRTSCASASQQRLGRTLIVAQVALATTLLSAGALLLSAFLHMRAIPSGVRPEHLYELQVHLKGEKYASSARSQQFVEAVEERLRAIPGVATTAASNGLPIDGGLNNLGYPAGHKELEGQVAVRFVTPGYFKAVGTTLLAGNDVSGSDTLTSAPVVLVSQRAASLWWPGRSPIGEYVFDDDTKPSRVIGVVADTHARGLAESAMPMIYHPYAQIPDDAMKTLNDWFPTTFSIRTAEGDSDPDIAVAAAAAVRAVDQEVPAAKFVPMQSFIDKSVAAPRFFSWLVGGFAGFALLLTVIGLFGLLSYQVASRTRELGVRMALGAQRYQVLGLVLHSGLLLTAMGLALGVAGSLALRRLVASLVANTVYIATSEAVSLLGNQSVSIALAAGAMLAAAIAASLIPARRAASIDPMEALRNE